MISIAICDDEKCDRQKVFNEISECLRDLDEDKKCKMRMFDNSKGLWYEVDDGTSFDVFFLDIGMPGMNGMDLSVLIKQKKPDSLIIFVTSHEEYVYESFKVQPFRFIPKSKLHQMLPDALSAALRKVKSQTGSVYVIKNQQGVEKILLKDIVYIWHEGKYAYLEKANNDNTKIRKTLKEIYAELDSDMFEWLARGCICNLSHIERIVGDCAYLSNGERQIISRRRIRGIKEKLREYAIRADG